MNPTELRQAINMVLKAKLVPMIAGSPGVGKSGIIQGIAGDNDLALIDMRLSQCDPTDLLGFPTHDGKRMGYAPPKHFPLKGLDVLPAGKRGWLVFLDEFSSAPLAVQAAAYKLVLDRQVGIHDLHPDVHIVCAGNKETDGAIVNRMGTAMQSRLVHLELETDLKSWVEWALNNGIDHRVISYVQSRPDELHKFDPDHNDKTFACPRTWEFASKLIKDATPDKMLMEILIGTLSAGVGRQFFSHLTYCSKLHTIEDIIRDPENIPIKDEPALHYAMSHMVAAYLDEKNSIPVMKYIERLPLEFGTISVRAALKRNRALLKVPHVRDWAHEVVSKVF